MRNYELVFIIHPEIDEDTAPELIERVENLIERNEGKVTNVERWGMRRLAYTIKGQDEGSYVLMHFELEPQRVKAVEQGLKLIEDVIRHMITRREE